MLHRDAHRDVHRDVPSDARRDVPRDVRKGVCKKAPQVLCNRYWEGTALTPPPPPHLREQHENSIF